MKKILKKELVIPAGTILTDIGDTTRSYSEGYFGVDIGLGKDSTASVVIDVDGDIAEWLEDAE